MCLSSPSCSAELSDNIEDPLDRKSLTRRVQKSRPDSASRGGSDPLSALLNLHVVPPTMQALCRLTNSNRSSSRSHVGPVDISFTMRYFSVAECSSVMWRSLEKKPCHKSATIVPQRREKSAYRKTGTIDTKGYGGVAQVVRAWDS